MGPSPLVHSEEELGSPPSYHLVLGDPAVSTGKTHRKTMFLSDKNIVNTDKARRPCGMSQHNTVSKTSLRYVQKANHGLLGTSIPG